MIYWIRILFIVVIYMCNSTALDLVKKYPSYTYVFNEFDVDKSYINDADFYDFVLKNENSLKQFYRRSLKRGKEILPTMKGLLLNEGVSDLFIYLSMIESGFSNHAVSSKKAVGLWQFMPATAKRFHLSIDKNYDERCDTKNSTAAAILYLNKLYHQFGKWYLAAMAYNCGEGCVQRAINLAGSDDLTLLIDDSLKYLPNETRDYIKKILLVALIGENSTLGLDLNQEDALVEVEVSGGTDLKKIAKLIKMKYTHLHKLNSKIKSHILAKKKKKYIITIPIEKIYAFYLRYESIEEVKLCKPNLISHHVSLGETLVSLAKKYDTSYEDIISTNHLDSEYLTVGQLLLIPVSQKVFDDILK